MRLGEGAIKEAKRFSIIFTIRTEFFS